MKTRKNTIALTAALLAVTLGAPAASAGTITAGALVTETMMEIQSFNNLVLYAAYGVDESTTLHFNTNVDAASQTFSFSSAAGSSYLGRPVNISGSGFFNSALDLFQWTTAGNVGDKAWSGAGDLQWVGDPHASPCFNVVLGGQIYRVCAELDVDGTGDSTGTYTLTGPDGTKYGPYGGTDHLTTGGWFHSIKVPKNPVTPDGRIDVIASAGNMPGLFRLPGGGFDGGGVGTYDVTVSPVPEPSTITMLGLGGILIGGSRMWKRFLGR